MRGDHGHEHRALQSLGNFYARSKTYAIENDAVFAAAAAGDGASRAWPQQTQRIEDFELRFAFLPWEGSTNVLKRSVVQAMADVEKVPRVGRSSALRAPHLRCPHTARAIHA